MSEKARRKSGDARSAADIAADQRCADYDLRLTLTAQGAWNVNEDEVTELLKDVPGADVYYLPSATRWPMIVGWDESAFLKRPGSKRTLTRNCSRKVQKSRTHKSSDEKDSETVTVFHNRDRTCWWRWIGPSRTSTTNEVAASQKRGTGLGSATSSRCTVC